MSVTESDGFSREGGAAVDQELSRGCDRGGGEGGREGEGRGGYRADRG